MYKYLCLPQYALKLTRSIALLLIACCLLPMEANADAVTPSWQGVWDGTIGKSKVIVCLAANSNSAYRYQRYQTDIPLSQHGEEWIEETVTGELSGTWSLGDAQGDTLEGNWHNPKTQRTLPIHLKKLAGTDSSAPCESRAYKNGVAEDASNSKAPSAAVPVNAGSAKQPEFAYVIGDGSISAYRINDATGAFIPIPGATDAIKKRVSSVTISPSGAFAYVANVNGTISVFRINATTGTLTPVSDNTVAAGKYPLSITVNPTGTFAYVTNRDGTMTNGDGDTVSIYSINATTGMLTQVSGGIAFEVNEEISSITINPTGTFAYMEFQSCPEMRV